MPQLAPLNWLLSYLAIWMTILSFAMIMYWDKC